MQPNGTGLITIRPKRSDLTLMDPLGIQGRYPATCRTLDTACQALISLSPLSSELPFVIRALPRVD